MADCMLMGQVFYYRRQSHHMEEVVCDYATSGTPPDEQTGLLNASSTAISSTKNPKTRGIIRLFYISSILLWVGLLAGSAMFFLWPGQSTDWSQWQIVPQSFGWGSAILYCASRIPQIMQNFRNESVQGLSLVMFIFSVVGNLTYCVVS